MDKVYEKYQDGIIYCQPKSFDPVSKLNLNRENGQTVFDVDIRDGFYIPRRTYLYIRGRCLNGTTPFDPKINIQLVDNFVAHIFKSGTLKINSTLVNQVENMGQTSTIKGTVSFALNDSGSTIVSGFQSQFLQNAFKDGNFSAMTPLCELGFTFFKDVNYPCFSGFQLMLVRNNDKDCVYGSKSKKADGTFDETLTPGEPTISIDDISLIVYPVEYEETKKAVLMNELQHLSEKNEYIIQFKTWQTIEKPGINGKSVTIPLSTLYRSNKNPLFIMFAFQKNRSNDHMVYTSEFDNMNLFQYYIEINGRKYPEDGVKVNFEDKDVSQAYTDYMDYRRRYGEGNKTLVYCKPKEFISARTIFVRDLVRQPDPISTANPKITLHMEFRKNIKESDNVTCYIIIVHPTAFHYDFLKNRMTEII